MGDGLLHWVKMGVFMGWYSIGELDFGMDGSFFVVILAQLISKVLET